MRNSTKTLAVFASLFALSACGGSESDGMANTSSAANADTSSGVPPLDSANGIYQGTIGFQPDAGKLATALVYNGQVLAFSPDRREMFDGYIDLQGNKTLSGELTRYGGEDLGRDSRAQLDGVIEPGEFINSAVRAGAEPGAALLNYAGGSAPFATLDRLSDIWSWHDASGREGAALYLDGRGALDGSNDAGCIYHGLVTAPEARSGIYLLDLSVSNCRERDGDYQGMGYIDGERGTLNLAFSNGRFAEVLPLTRHGTELFNLPAPSLPLLPEQVDLPNTPDRVDLPNTPDQVDLPDDPRE